MSINANVTSFSSNPKEYFLCVDQNNTLTVEAKGIGLKKWLWTLAGSKRYDLKNISQLVQKQLETSALSTEQKQNFVAALNEKITKHNTLAKTAGFFTRTHIQEIVLSVFRPPGVSQTTASAATPTKPTVTKTVDDKKQKNELAEALLIVERDEPAETAKQIKDLLVTPGLRMAVQKLLDGVPPDQIAPLLCQMPFLLNAPHGGWDLVTAVGEISPEDRLQVITQAKPVLEEVGNTAQIVRAVTGMAPEERAKLLKQIQLLAKSVDRRVLMEIVLAIPMKKRVDVLENGQFLFTKGITSYQGMEIVEDLQEIAEGEEVDVLKNTQLLCKVEDNNYVKMLILRSVAKTPQKDRVDMLSFITHSLLKEVDDESIRSGKIEAFANMPQDARKEVMKPSFSSLWATFSDYELSKVLNIASKLDVAEISKTLLFRIQSLMEGTDSSYAYRSIMLQKLQEMSQDEIIDVLDHTLPLLKKNNEEALGRSLIVDAVAQIPKNDRAAVLDLVVRILDRALVGYEYGICQSEIIGIVAGMSKDERADVESEILPQLQQIPEIIERREMLKVVAGVRKEEKAEVLNQMQALLEGITNNFQRWGILGAVQEIPADKRLEALKKAQLQEKNEIDNYKAIYDVLRNEG